MSIVKRGRLYHLSRRVPRRYRGIEPRETVWISLHTDSETVARSKADRVWSQMIEACEARLAGNVAGAEAKQAPALCMLSSSTTPDVSGQGTSILFD